MKDFAPIVILNLIVVAIWAFLFVVGCAGGGGYLPTAAELDAAGMVRDEKESAALGRGRALAITECSSCHRFYWPQEYSPGEWEEIMRKMTPRTSLEEDQAADLTLYLSTASRAPVEGVAAPGTP